MSALDDLKKKYGVSQPVNELDALKKKYGVGDTVTRRSVSQSSGVFSAPEAFTTNRAEPVKEAAPEVVAGTGLGLGMTLPTRQQATGALADVSKQMHEDATEGLDQLKKDKRAAAWDPSSRNPESENFKTSEDWDKERESLEGARDTAAKNYYGFAGQDAVNKVLGTKGASGAFSSAVEAAVTANDLLDKYRNGGWNPEAATAMKNATEAQGRAVDILVSYGVDKATAERAIEYQAGLVRQGKAAARAQETEEWAKEHKGLASVISVATNPTQGLDYLNALARNQGRNSTKDLESYRPITGADFQNTAYTAALRSGASSELGTVGKFLYDTGMSMVDSFVLANTVGPLTGVLLGAGAASSSAKNALDRGATNKQALAVGFAAGAAEMLFESLSVERLLKIQNVDTAKQYLKSFLQQGVTEGSEEVFTEIANILTDTAIMGQNSNFEAAVKDYQKEGLSEEAAMRKAYLDSLVQVGLAAAGGFLSGTVMGGAQATPSYVYNKAYQNYLEKNLNTNQINILSVAQEFAADSDTRKLADQISTAINDAAENDRKVEISPDQWGRLMQSMEAERDQFGPADPGAVDNVLRPNEATLSSTAQALIDAGADAKTANTKGALLERLRSGDSSLSNEELRALDLNSPATRAVFKSLLGVELPGVTDGHVLNRAALDAARSISAHRTAQVEQQAAQQAVAEAVQEAEVRGSEAERNLEAEVARMVQEKAAQMSKPAQTADAQETQNPATETATGEESRASVGEIAPETSVAPEAVKMPQRGSAKSLLDYVTRVNQSNADVRQRTQETTVKVLNSNLKALGATATIEVKNLGQDGPAAQWNPDGRIELNADVLDKDGGYRHASQHAIVYTLTHELFHEASSKQGGESSQWTKAQANELIEFGKNRVGEEKWAARVESMRNAQISAMMKDGYTREQAEARLTEDYLNEELAADVLRDVFYSQGKLNLFAKEHRSTLTKIRDWLQKKFDALLGREDAGNRELVQEMNRIIKNVNEALTKTVDANETRTKEDAPKTEERGVRFSPQTKTPSPDSVPEWDAQVNALMNGTFDELFWGDGGRRSSLYVMFEPTALLQELGLSDLPLVITQDHAKGFHGLTEAQFRSLPELIRHPVAVFRDDPNGDHPGGVNLLTSEKVDGKDPIFVAINPDQQNFTWDKKRGPAHFVNVFGRKNARAYIDRAFENGDVLFVDKEKFDADPWLAPTAGPALSTADSIESGAIIGQKRHTVKPGERKFSPSVSPETDAEYMRAVENDDIRYSVPTLADTNTEEFRQWFNDDSGELTNPDGTPKVFLRGTIHSGSAKFRKGNGTVSGGLFFSTSLDAAKNYALHTGRDYERQEPREFKHRVVDSWEEAVEFVKNDLRDEFELTFEGGKWRFRVFQPDFGLDMAQRQIMSRVVDNEEGFVANAAGLAEFNDYYEADLKSWDEVEEWARENFNDGFEMYKEEPEDITIPGTSMVFKSKLPAKWYVVERAGKWVDAGTYANTAKGLERFNKTYSDAIQQNHPRNPGWSQYYLTATKTLVVDAEGRDYRRVMKDKNGMWMYTDHVVQQAWKDGYDCVVIKNVLDGNMKMEFDEFDNFGATEDLMTDYIVKDPGQVKSIYNTGSFDRKNPDVRYSVNVDDVPPSMDPILEKMVSAGVAKNMKSAKNKLAYAMPDNLKWFVERYMSGAEFTDEDRENVLHGYGPTTAESEELDRFPADSVDSRGRELSEGQKLYFENSKMRDSAGRLMPMYHGTKNFGFTIFDPAASDDGRSLFFASTTAVAGTYAGVDNVRTLDAERDSTTSPDPDRMNWAAAKAAIKRVLGNKVIVTERDGYLWIMPDFARTLSPEDQAEWSYPSEDVDSLLDNLETVLDDIGMTRKLRELQTLIEETVPVEERSRGTYGVYEVYLNLEHPLIMDAHGRSWNELQYNRVELDPSNADARWRGSHTRDVARYAKNNGYDGVIFRNLHDVGGPAASGTIADIAVAFSGEQAKQVTNSNPTPHKDSRYSPNSDYQTGGNTGNVNPETGFRRGSVADSFMRIWNTGAQDEAINTLEYILTRLAELEAEAQERNLRDLRAAVLKPRVTEEIAERNRRHIERLIERYGMIPQTSGAQQEVRLPEQTDDETYVAGATQTIMAHEVTNELLADELVQDILAGNAGVTYARIGDRETLKQVDDEFERQGVAGFMRQWKNKVNGGEGMTKLDIARAEKLYVELAGAKEFTDEGIRDILNLVAEISAAGTQAGQTVQAMTLLKKMTPTGQLYYIQKAVDRLNRSPNQKSPITINEQLAKRLAEAKTISEINAAVDAIITDIAQQVPVSLADKWNTWRYFAMLGNPRTHIRNLLGNAIFAPARLAKNVIGTGLERAILRGERADQRTKAIVSSKELRDFAEQDAEEMKDILRGGGKYNTSDMIRDKRIIFKKAPWLNTATQKNSELLEMEDWVFLRSSYQSALAGFLSARGITDVNDLLDTNEGRKTLNEAREYAVREAQRATYRDMSKLASMLNSGKRNLPKPLGWLLEGIVPFTKTPVNIVKRGFEYSPLGVVKTIYDAANRGVAKVQREHGKTVKRDTLNAAEVIDELAANLTGTGVAVLGVLLSRLGMLTAGLGEDDEDKFKELYGDQAYSLSIPGVGSYTIDWMAPVALPLFVGAEIYNTIAEDYGDLTPSEIVDAVADGMTTILEPMLSLSMLDGVNEALSANKFGDSEDAIWNVLSAALGSYVSQGIPTALGQVARTIDPNRRTTFTEKGEGKVNSQLQRFWQSSVQGKVPVYQNDKLAYVDAWGRTDTTGNVLLRAFENFISPGYINSSRKTGVETELERLAKAEKDTSVMPDRAAKYFSVNKETYAMSKDEYEEHLIDRGQTSYRLVSDFINDPAYQQMSDKDRVAVIRDIYEYAKQTACYHTNSEYDLDTWVESVDAYVRNGGDAVEYITMRHMSDGDPSELAYGRSDLSASEMGTLVLGDTSSSQRAPKTFADPIHSGYEYELNDAQRAEYTEMYDAMFNEEFADLYESTKYRNADAEKRKELIGDLRADVAKDVKKAIAKLLRQQGIKSTKK